MSEFQLKSTEGVAHAMGDEYDVSVDTRRQHNARTQCLFITYDASDHTTEDRKRAFFVRSIMRGDGSVTQLSENKITVTHFK